MSIDVRFIAKNGLDGNAKPITGVGDPVAATDAVNLRFLQSRLSETVANVVDQIPPGVDFTVQTGNTTATNQQGIIADTSSGSFTVSLPANPAAGTQVVLVDGADWGVNNLTVDPNGSTINDSTNPLVLNQSGVVTFIYTGTTWKVYTQQNIADTPTTPTAGGIVFSRYTSNVVASDKQGIIADTSSGSFAVTLPASPAVGTQVVIADGADWSLHNLIVERNGSTIESIADNLILDVAGLLVWLIYNGTTWQAYSQAGFNSQVSQPVSGGISYNKYTSNVVASDKQGIIADTSAGSFTVTLPANPSVGTQVVIVDSADWGINNLTVARNGATIEGLAEDLILDVGGTSITFIYNGSTWQTYSQVGGYADGAGGSGGISYNRYTSNITATNKQGIIADTSGGSFTVTLPANPSVGNQVSIVDGADWGLQPLTVGRNGSTIEGTSEDLILDIEGSAVNFIYNGTTWQVYAQIGGISGSASGGGGIEYSKFTSNVTASNKQGIIADTSAGSFSVTLPINPSVGYQVSIVDGADWGVNPLTVLRNGSTIEGFADDLVLNVSGAAVDLIYNGSTWQVYSQVGGYAGMEPARYAVYTASVTAAESQKLIADTSTGSFTVTLPANPQVGSYVTIVDGADWSVNPLTVARNGSTIENQSDDLVLDVGGVAVNLVYSGSTWQVFAQGGVANTNASSANTPNSIVARDAAGSFAANVVTVNNLVNLSDAALKDNVSDINGLDLLAQVRPVQYNWKNTSIKSYGVIAQELEQTFPELVAMDQQGIKSVNYIPMIAMLISAVKSLQQQVDALKSK